MKDHPEAGTYEDQAGNKIELVQVHRLSDLAGRGPVSKWVTDREGKVVEGDDGYHLASAVGGRTALKQGEWIGFGGPPLNALTVLDDSFVQRRFTRVP